MTQRLQGKNAILTGAGSGIGRATALLFAREGAALVLTDVNEPGLRQVEGEIKDIGGDVVIRKTDVSAEEEIKGLISLALEKFTHIDILVNNAGIGGGLDILENQTREEWQRVYEVNVLGPVYATKHIIAHMKERRCGSIINIASVAGLLSGAGGNAYSASKAALINFTKTSACEVGSHNVRINAVCPGLIETGMTQPFLIMPAAPAKRVRSANTVNSDAPPVPKKWPGPFFFWLLTKPATLPARPLQWMAVLPPP